MYPGTQSVRGYNGHLTCYNIIIFTYLCLQHKEPVGDSEELPENVLSCLGELTPELLQVQLIS